MVKIVLLVNNSLAYGRASFLRVILLSILKHRCLIALGQKKAYSHSLATDIHVRIQREEFRSICEHNPMDRTSSLPW
jgi:hypothetical protein